MAEITLRKLLGRLETIKRGFEDREIDPDEVVISFKVDASTFDAEYGNFMIDDNARFIIKTVMDEGI
ncbi:MAG: hypothetical protein AB7D03_03700 [Thiomicrospira sp.]